MGAWVSTCIYTHSTKNARRERGKRRGKREHLNSADESACHPNSRSVCLLGEWQSLGLWCCFSKLQSSVSLSSMSLGFERFFQIWFERHFFCLYKLPLPSKTQLPYIIVMICVWPEAKSWKTLLFWDMRKMKSFVNPQITNAGEGVERREPAYTGDGNVNWCSLYGEQYRGSLKN